MKIGELASQLGIPASTIRYYEQVGLIEAPPRVSGRREYGDSAVYALEFVRLSQAAGFSIAETKSLLDAYAADQSATGAWQAIAMQKQAKVREQIQSLQKVDAILAELISCKCQTLNECIEIGLARKVGGNDANH